MAVPRIGRADRLAALDDVPRGPFAPPRSPRPLARFVSQPSSPLPLALSPSIFLPLAPGPSHQALATAAAELARQLAPLPRALDEIAARILQHCVHRGHPQHDEALLLLDALQTRSRALWRAVATLAAACEKAPQTQPASRSATFEGG